jgi:UDP-N-acetylglucosamine 1-carboxyvinyltransferase
MARFIIQGRRPLSGTFRPSGNKNAALPMLAACVLTDEPVILRNVPEIVDVAVMCELLTSLGAAVECAGDRVTVRAAGLRRRRLDAALCRRIRSSILFAGPMAARHGRAEIPPPGGDGIGRRSVETHRTALQALGIESSGGEVWTFRRRVLRGAPILLDEASVTATENAMMAAALAPGTTTIYNAACEPHVQDLGRMLGQMGAVLRGLGTNCIEIEGVERLRGAEVTVGPDYVEAASFLAAAAVTGGALRVEGAFDEITHQIMVRGFGRLGAAWTRDPSGLSLPARGSLRIPSESQGVGPKIEDGPWPAFPSDLMSVAIVLATQARGQALFFEKLFESRMYFADRLIEMGAKIIACDPHRVLVSGPVRLRGGLVSSPDIRAGMALVIAALCARGESIIENAQMIDRGYARLDERLRELGARIERA